MRLLNVTPRPAAPDVGDCRLRHAVLIREIHAALASRAAAPYRAHIVSRQPMARMALPFDGDRLPACGPALGVSIAHIVVGGANEQVARVHTRRIVATMEHGETVWDRSIRQHPGDPMGAVHPAAVADEAIAPLVHGGRPLPAVIRPAAFDLCPETLLHRHGLVSVRRHNGHSNARRCAIGTA